MRKPPARPAPGRETPPDNPAVPPSPRWQPRFGLGTMMLVMLVCGVMSSAGFYLVRGNQSSTDAASGGTRLHLVFMLIVLAGPLLLAVVMSAAIQISRHMNRRKR